RDVTFHYWRMKIFLLPANYTLNKVSKVVSLFIRRVRRRGTGFLVSSHPGLIAPQTAVDRQVPLRPIKQVTDRVFVSASAKTRIYILCPTTSVRTGRRRARFGRFSGAPCGRFPCANSSFGVRYPMPNLEFEHLAFSVGEIEFEDGVQRVWSLLVIVKHEVTTHGRDLIGKPQT